MKTAPKSGAELISATLGELQVLFHALQDDMSAEVRDLGHREHSASVRGCDACDRIIAIVNPYCEEIARVRVFLRNRLTVLIKERNERIGQVNAGLDQLNSAIAEAVWERQCLIADLSDYESTLRDMGES